MLNEGRGRASHVSLPAVRRRKALLAAATAFTLTATANLAPAFVWPSVPERIAKVLEAGDPEARREAALQLVRLSASQAEPLVTKALGDEDVEVRLFAARAGARLLLHTAAEAAIPWLSEADPRLRLAAAELLRKVPLAKASAALGRVLSDPEPRVRIAAAGALGELDGPEPVIPLLGRLDDPNAAVRVEVVRSLSRLSDARATFALVGKLNDAAPEVRAEAARALARLSDPQSSGALARSLRDPSPEVRIAALEALGRLRAEDAVSAIAELLDEPNAVEVERAALRALGEIGSDEAVTVLVRELREEKPSAASTPARKALVAAGPDAVEPLLDLLNAPPSPRAAENAALTLAELRSERAPAAILTGLRRGNLGPEAGLRALGLLGDPSVTAKVLEHLAHPRASVRLEAAQALQAILRPENPDGRAVEPVVEALRRKGITSTEKAALIGVLGRTGSPRALPELGYWAKTKELRRPALAALGNLGPMGQDEVLLEALEDEQATVRWEAAKALAAAASEPTTLRLLDDLVNAAVADRGALGVAVSGAMARATSEEIVERAAELIESANETARDAIFEGLGRQRGARAGALLAKLARTGSVEDRRKIAEALAGHPEAKEAFFLLAEDAHPSVRATAIWSLAAAAATGNLAAEPLLGRPETSAFERALASLEDADATVVANAVAAVARLAKAAGTDEARKAAVTTLCQALDRRGGYVRANALAGLRLLEARCADGGKEREILRRDASEAARMEAAKLIRSVLGSDEEADERALLRCEIDERAARVAALCRRGEGAPETGSAPIAIFVIPDGRTEPLPSAPFALKLPDGFVRLGMADRRGAILEMAAPKGSLTLLPPDEL